MADLSIAQYISSAERNLRSSLMPPGYFAKQTYLQVSMCSLRPMAERSGTH